MSAKDQLKSMISKLNEITQYLGGDKTTGTRKQSEFDFIKANFLKKRHQLEKILDKKQDTKADQGALLFQFKQGLTDAQQCLQKLKQEQKRQENKKINPELIQRQRAIVENCVKLFQNIKQRHLGKNYQTKQKYQTLTDLKAKLLKDIKLKQQQIDEIGSQDGLGNGSQDTLQKEAMKQFKKNDEQIDDKAKKIIAGLQKIHVHVKNINENNDLVNQRIQKNAAKIGKLQRKIESQNEKLKKVIQQYRPNNCCLTITLLLLVIGLVIVVINLFKK